MFCSFSFNSVAFGDTGRDYVERSILKRDSYHYDKIDDSSKFGHAWLLRNCTLYAFTTDNPRLITKICLLNCGRNVYTLYKCPWYSFIV